MGMASRLLGMNTSGELLIGVIQSQSVQDRVIKKLNLMQVYSDKYIEDGRKDLTSNTSLTSDTMTTTTKDAFLAEYASRNAIFTYSRATAGLGISYLLDHEYRDVYLQALRLLPAGVLEQGICVLEFGCGAEPTSDRRYCQNEAPPPPASVPISLCQRPRRTALPVRSSRARYAK